MIEHRALESALESISPRWFILTDVSQKDGQSASTLRRAFAPSS